eukprot:713607-Prorocentrum_minimum.AAC.1
MLAEERAKYIVQTSFDVGVETDVCFQRFQRERSSFRFSSCAPRPGGTLASCYLVPGHVGVPVLLRLLAAAS